jgi:hypothetical protein
MLSASGAVIIVEVCFPLAVRAGTAIKNSEGICYMITRERAEILTNPQWASVEETCEIASFGRSRLYQLLDDHPEVKTLSLKRPGKTKGRRLIHIPSLLSFMERTADTQNQAATVVA